MGYMICTICENLFKFLENMCSILIETSKRWSHLSPVSMGVFLKKSTISLYFIDCRHSTLLVHLLNSFMFFVLLNRHYLMSENQCGLDLSMARCFFEKLSQNEKVLKEVAKYKHFAQFMTISDIVSEVVFD